MNHILRQQFHEQGPDTLSSLEAGLEDPSPLVRRTAAHLLVRLGEPSVSALVPALDHPDPKVARIAMDALADHGVLLDHFEKLTHPALFRYLPTALERFPRQDRMEVLRNITQRFEEAPETTRERILLLLTAMAPLPNPPLDNPTEWPDETRPMAFWRFEGGNPRRIEDLSGNHYHLMAHGNPSFTEGPGGQALFFDGETYLESSAPEELGEQFTLEIWVQADATDVSGYQGLFRGSRHRPRLMINPGAHFAPGGRIHFGTRNPEDRIDLIGGNLQAGVWHRITCVVDRPMVRVFLDGIPVAAGEWDHLSGPVEWFRVGDGGSRNFEGKIAAIALYPYALSLEEIVFGEKEEANQ